MGTADSKENLETEDPKEKRVKKEGKPFSVLIFKTIKTVITILSQCLVMSLVIF